MQHCSICLQTILMYRDLLIHKYVLLSVIKIFFPGNSLVCNDKTTVHMKPSTAIVRTMNQDALEMLEYPFITMQHYPPGFVLNLGT